MKNRLILILIVAFLCTFLSCSISTMAMDMVADMLTGEGGASSFTSDNDPKLVGDALPFAIKLYETLLASNPEHEGLLLTTGSLFIMYANAFVQGPAEMLPSYQYEERETALERSKQLYLRGYEILRKALELKYKGFGTATVNDGSMQLILSRVKKEDVGLLYWTVAGGLSAYSIDILDFELSASIPDWTAMINRAYELDPDFGGATLDEFFIILYASLPEGDMGGDKDKAEYHFKKAIEKTKGNSVGAYVSFAQLVCVPAEDYDSFKDSLEKAIAIDVNIDMDNRLVNVINQQKAHWLLDNAWMFFYFLPMPDDDYYF